MVRHGRSEGSRVGLDDSFTGSVCDYSIGFLKFRKDEKHEIAVPAGTGTFVKIGVFTASSRLGTC